MAFTIRPFAVADAEAWLGVHYAAVRGIAASDYSQAVIDAWAPTIDPRTAEQLRTGALGTRIVAELGTSEIAGIAELRLESGEIAACYVSPAFARCGAGTAMMAELEALARKAGLAALTVHSSVTAEHFYSHLGYRVTGRGFHILHTGEPMRCVFMRKAL